MKKLFLVSVMGVVAVLGCKSTQEKKPAKEKKPTETKKPSDPKVSELIKKLGSDKYDTREQATKELKKMGYKIISILEKELKETNDTEVKYRLELILEHLKKLKIIVRSGLPREFVEVFSLEKLKAIEKWGITERLLKEFPDLLEKLESKDIMVQRDLVLSIGLLIGPDTIILPKNEAHKYKKLRKDIVSSTY